MARSKMISMTPEEASVRIVSLRDETGSLPRDRQSSEFASWQARVQSVLSRVLGAEHHITKKFVDLKWSPSANAIFGSGSTNPYAIRMESSFHEARGILEAAGAELDLLAADGPAADESGIDAELWEHIAPEIASESWAKVASQAALFTEDRIRKWAGRPDGEVGKDLAVAVFGAAGDFKMGRTPGQTTGWQLYAQGFAQAVRNVDLHTIQERSDLKRYAMGVAGACSLLLTQMRYEHGNRFRDTGPAQSTE